MAVSTAPAHDHPTNMKPMKGARQAVFLSDLSVEAQCVEAQCVEAQCVEAQCFNALCFNALCFNALCFNARVRTLEPPVPQ